VKESYFLTKQQLDGKRGSPRKCQEIGVKLVFTNTSCTH